MPHYFIDCPDTDDSTPTEMVLPHPPRPGEVIRLTTGLYHLVLAVTVIGDGVRLQCGESGMSEHHARLLAWQDHAASGLPPPPGPSPFTEK